MRSAALAALPHGLYLARTRWGGRALIIARLRTRIVAVVSRDRLAAGVENGAVRQREAHLAQRLDVDAKELGGLSDIEIGHNVCGQLQRQGRGREGAWRPREPGRCEGEARGRAG